MMGDDTASLCGRLRRIRIDMYGEEGIPPLSGLLGIPPQTWGNYEEGVKLPGVIALRLVALTGVRAVWLLTGKGRRYGIPFSARRLAQG